MDKLREAHKTSAPAKCSVVWAHDGSYLVTSCSSDTEVLIHDTSAPRPGRSGGHGVRSSRVVLRRHREGVTAIAVGPMSGQLASGSIDRSVNLYGFPGMVALVVCIELRAGFKTECEVLN